VERIVKTIKTLILEIMDSNGPSHIREIHLQVTELRPEVPQHTVRARLSEMSRNESLEHKLEAFGNGFYGLYEENKDLCSVVSYPDRGPWGESSYRGNCSGYLVKDLILRFHCQSVFDPAEGSGTVRDIIAGLNQYLQKDIVAYEGRDLKESWDVLTSQLPDKQYDLVWYHPPYWDIIRYSDNPNDLSNCNTLDEFEQKLNQSVERLYKVIRPGGVLAILIGDKRKDGRYYPLFRSLLTNPMIGELKSIIIKIQHNERSGVISYRNNPFLIPIKHEYCLIYQKSPANNFRDTIH
jgi:hypothetical protein